MTIHFPTHLPASASFPPSQRGKKITTVFFALFIHLMKKKKVVVTNLRSFHYSFVKYVKQNIFLVWVRLLLAVIQCGFSLEIFLTKCVLMCARLHSVSPGPERPEQSYWGRDVSHWVSTLVSIGIAGSLEHHQCQHPWDLDYIGPRVGLGVGIFYKLLMWFWGAPGLRTQV